MKPNPDADLSVDDPVLLRAVQTYLAELESGRRPARAEFVSRFPGIADELASYLDALDMVHGAAPKLRPPVTEPLPIEPLGDFRIVREIGRGGMGVVYEAVQLSLGRRVALKVLPFASALDTKQLQRFQNEAQAAAHLHHTNIVPVYAVGCERGTHFYAMQLIEGENLADLISQMRPREGPATRSGPLVGGKSRSVKRSSAVHAGAIGVTFDLPPTGPEIPPLAESVASATVTPAAAELSTQRASRSGSFYRTAARLAAQAAEALEYAHQLGVIHRDIKPANLMVDARGNLWVTDFGLAQFHSGINLTRTGDLLGTLRYMSPEQAAGQHTPLDARTDIYSLGATLYELLTLQPLFDGADHRRLLQQIFHDEPRPLRSLERAIPPELETIVLKAVSKNPGDRYGTAQEFADDLHRFLDNMPIQARRPTLTQRARKWTQRHPSVVVTGVLLCLLTAVGSLTAALLIRDEQKKTDAAYKRERERARQAEERFQLAQRSADKLFQFAEEELVDNPQLQGLRKRLLEAVLEDYQDFIEQRRDDPDAQAALAEMRNRVQNILDDLTVLQGAGQIFLLRESAVLDDLKATSEQREQLQIEDQALEDKRRDWFNHKRTAEDRRQRFLELVKAEEAIFARVLSKEQVRRLRQIALQSKGIGAFRDTDVSARLKLTPKQREDIRSIEAEMWDKNRPGPQQEGKPGKKPDEIRKAAMVKVLAVLSEDQAKRWKQMTGDPFVRPPPEPRPGPRDRDRKGPPDRDRGKKAT